MSSKVSSSLPQPTKKDKPRTFVKDLALLCSNKQIRFPAEDMATLKSLNKVLNPKHLPRAMQMSDFGHDHIQLLAEAFPQIILDRAKGDYRLFKFFLNRNRELDLQQLCTKLIREKSEDFPAPFWPTSRSLSHSPQSLVREASG